MSRIREIQKRFSCGCAPRERSSRIAISPMATAHCRRASRQMTGDAPEQIFFKMIEAAVYRSFTSLLCVDFVQSFVRAASSFSSWVNSSFSGKGNEFLPIDSTFFQIV